VQKLAKELQRPYIETSATADINITAAFAILIRMLRIKFQKRQEKQLAAARKQSKESPSLSVSSRSNASLPKSIRDDQASDTSPSGGSGSNVAFSPPLMPAPSPSANASAVALHHQASSSSTGNNNNNNSSKPSKDNIIGKMLKKAKKGKKHSRFSEMDFSDWPKLLEQSRDGEMGLQVRA
jgi:hypothetical protein